MPEGSHFPGIPWAQWKSFLFQKRPCAYRVQLEGQHPWKSHRNIILLVESTHRLVGTWQPDKCFTFKRSSSEWICPETLVPLTPGCPGPASVPCPCHSDSCGRRDPGPPFGLSAQWRQSFYWRSNPHSHSREPSRSLSLFQPVYLNNCWDFSATL